MSEIDLTKNSKKNLFEGILDKILGRGDKFKEAIPVGEYIIAYPGGDTLLVLRAEQVGVAKLAPGERGRDALNIKYSADVDEADKDTLADVITNRYKLPVNEVR